MSKTAYLSPPKVISLPYAPALPPMLSSFMAGDEQKSRQPSAEQGQPLPVCSLCTDRAVIGLASGGCRWQPVPGEEVSRDPVHVPGTQSMSAGI